MKVNSLRVKPDACVTAVSWISYIRAGQSIKYQLPGRQRGGACPGLDPPLSEPRRWAKICTLL